MKSLTKEVQDIYFYFKKQIVMGPHPLAGQEGLFSRADNVM